LTAALARCAEDVDGYDKIANAKIAVTGMNIFRMSNSSSIEKFRSG
jgi:hypothetical protein